MNILDIIDNIKVKTIYGCICRYKGVYGRWT